MKKSSKTTALKIAAITMIGLGSLTIIPKANAGNLTLNDPLVEISKDVVNLNTIVGGCEFVGASILAFMIGAKLVKELATK